MKSISRIACYLIFAVCSVSRGDELHLTQPLVEQQLLLFNGWMHSIDNGDGVYESYIKQRNYMDLAPVKQVTRASLGGESERRVSEQELERSRQSLTSWIAILAKQPTYRANPESNESAADLGQLETRYVALHFVLGDPDSANLCREQAQAYGQVEALADSAQQLLKDINTGIAASKQKGSNSQSAEEIKANITAFERKTSEIVAASKKVSYPVNAAWEVRSNAMTANGISHLHDNAELERFRDLSSGCSYALSNIQETAELAAEHCARMSEAIKTPPLGLDFDTLEFVFGCAVPESAATDKELTSAIALLDKWLIDTELAPAVALADVRPVVPFSLKGQFTANDAYWTASKDLKASNYTKWLNDQVGSSDLDKYFTSNEEAPAPMGDTLFYKFVSAMGSDPASTRIDVGGRGRNGRYAWHNGHTSGSITELTSGNSEIPVSSQSLVDAMRSLSPVSTTLRKGSSLSNPCRMHIESLVKPSGGVASIVRDDPNYLLARIRNARGLVVLDEKLWEDVEINLLIVPAGSGVKLICIADGRWAKGLLRPTSVQGFRDFEPEYSKELNEFAGRLLVNIRDSLEKPAAKK